MATASSTESTGNVLICSGVLLIADGVIRIVFEDPETELIRARAHKLSVHKKTWRPEENPEVVSTARVKGFATATSIGRGESTTDSVALNPIRMLRRETPDPGRTVSLMLGGSP